MAAPSKIYLDQIRRVTFRKAEKRCPSCGGYLKDGIEMGKACCILSKKPVKKQLVAC